MAEVEVNPKAERAAKAEKVVKSNVTCYHCGGKGHKAPDCFKKEMSSDDA